jgi:tetratricopeptide (TPR) repeat protein
MGNVLVNTNRGGQGMAEFEQALALNPNLADAHAYTGFALLVNGHAEETESHVLEALRLSPRDTNAYIWLGFITASKLYVGADEEAVALYRRANEINPNRPISHVYLAAALAELGRLDEARHEVGAALALNPKLTIRRIQAGAQSENLVFLKQRERLIETMRKAGLPEG